MTVVKPFHDLYKPCRYKIYYGGRGARKSWEISQALLILGAKSKKLILCTREFQGSIQDSVHRLLSDQITRLGLEHFYTVQNQIIKGLNGTEIIFEGLKSNITKIKSLEGVDVVWCEEAENITERSWEVLVPTIRKPGSEIWVSFNPFDEMDATYQMYVNNTPVGAVIHKVSYKDNPDFPAELEQERLACKEKNYKKYLHIWEGEPNADYEDSIIQPDWFNAAIDAHIKLGFEPMGIKVVGFDPADEGDDEKALVYRYGSVVLSVDSWISGDLNDAINRAFTIADEVKANKLVYDSIGVGSGIKVGLKDRIYGRDIVVEGFCGSEKTRDPESKHEGDRLNKDVFRNLRAQYYWRLRDRFEKTYHAVVNKKYIDPQELISISSGIKCIPELRSELCRIQRKRGQNTYIQIESKTDMVKRMMPSPNMADALMYSFANYPPKTFRKKKLKPRIAIA